MSNSKRKALEGSGRGTVGKAAVAGMKQRDCKIVAMHIEQTDQGTLLPIVEETVKQGSKVYTDESKFFVNLNRAFDHESVKHNSYEYVRNKVSTNSMESFWTLIKREYNGMHHWWSLKHLHRYAAECTCRQNMCDITGLYAIEALIQASEGKHRSYTNLIQQ